MSTGPPLWRNRDFMLLQAGGLLSNTGTQASLLAYPLLVLALTHSPADAGLVGFARSLPALLWALPAGELADRRSRRALMMTADAGRLVALALLGVGVITGWINLAAIAAVAFVEGSGSALFGAGQSGALRSVVPVAQLPAAAGAETGRGAVVRLAGPPLGGLLFGLGRALPFLADAASYLASLLSLSLMRTPFQQPRSPSNESLGHRLREGARFTWGHPFLRTTALLFGLANFVGGGVLLAMIVIARQQHLSPAAVSLLVAAFAGALLVGSLLSPLVRARVGPRLIVAAEAWAWTSAFAFVAWPRVWVLAGALAVPALVIPSTDSVVHGYRIAFTPDHLLGRAEAVRSLISLSLAPLAPLLGGFLLAWSARAAVGLFAAVALALAVWASASAAIRDAPRIEDLAPG